MASEDDIDLWIILFGPLSESSPWLTGTFLIGLIVAIQGLKIYSAVITEAAGRLKARQLGQAAALGIGPDSPDETRKRLTAGKKVIWAGAIIALAGAAIGILRASNVHPR